MSDAPPTPAPPLPTAQQAANNSLWTPQSIIALITLGVVALTIAGVFWKADPPTLQLVIGLVIGGYGKDIMNFYYGSSKGSQDKDAASAKLQERAVVPER